MTGPGPSDPAGQGPAPGTPDPAQPAGGSWEQAPTPGAAPTTVQQAQQWKPAEVAAGPTAGIVYADLGTRIIALIIDGITLGILGLLVNAILLAILFSALFTGGLFFIGGLIIIAINVCLGLIYFVYTWTTMKASPGQRVLGLMTVNEADGNALTTNQAIMRYLVMFAPGYVASLASNVVGGAIGLLLSLAGLGWSIYLLYTTANDPKRQGFHDKYAKSVVIKPVAV
jgi:uncharacterized RDD family membrane protein YckC